MANNTNGVETPERRKSDAAGKKMEEGWRMLAERGDSEADGRGRRGE